MKRIIEVLDQSVIDEQLNSGYQLTTCPVCGNETFDDYFICPHCGWENDGTVNLEEFSTVNNSSIKEYKENLKLT